jgi:GDP-4-dehydro-6-deoxy-D-mannose reductase
VSSAILVTGATGFIGRALVEGLRAQGRAVIALGSADGDIREPSTLTKWLERDVDAVVHLAGRSFVPDSWSIPAEFIDVNVSGTARALEFCRARRARMVFVSGYLYGVPESLPISENARVSPNNPYALSKHIGENLCAFYTQYREVPVSVIRPFNVYGPGQPEQFLIPKILRQLATGKDIEVMDLNPRRDWVFVGDVADSIIAALGAVRRGYNVYNVGSGTSYSVAEVIQVAQKVARTKAVVRSAQAVRPNEIQDVVADVGKAARELRWHPRVDLEEGISKTFSSIVGHP